MDRATAKQRINTLLGKYKYPVLVVLVGLGLMLLPGKSEAPVRETPSPAAQVQSLEEQLEQLLSQIEGAGRVEVLLTEESGRETLYQTDVQSDTDESGTRRSDDTVLVEDASRNKTGLVRQTLEPKYRGAVVLCQGAEQPGVRLAVVEAVRCVTGLGADRISVQSMK